MKTSDAIIEEGVGAGARCRRHRLSGSLCAAMLLALGVVTACSCSTLSGSQQRERKAGVFSPERSKLFQTLIGARSARVQERTVLERLVAEKNGEVADIDARLRSEYGMAADRSYQYNPTNRTIYLVKENEGRTELLPHRAFPEDEDSQEFLAVVLAKQMTMRQIGSFQEVIREKQLEEARVTEALRSFGVRPEGQYRFDAESRTLWEILPPEPKPEKRPAAKDSAKPATEAKPVAKPAVKPAAAPAAKAPAAKDSAKPATEAKPVAKPVVKPAAASAAKAPAKSSAEAKSATKAPASAAKPGTAKPASAQ